mgnify:FL=1
MTPPTLARMPWLIDRSYGEVDSWLVDKGLDADALRRTELEGNNLVLAASRAGSGVSMHPRAVVERDLKAGNLVVLWDEVDDNRGLGYYILTPRGADAAKVKVFLDWLGTQD